MAQSALASARALPRPEVQALACGAAIVAAQVLPQLFHVAGAALGIGSALGETLLPMHLPVLLVGFMAGPWAGLVAGALSPMVSVALSGMPTAAMAPFMVVELAAYGAMAGLLRGVRMNLLVKVVVAQVVGRLVRACALGLATMMALGTTVPPAVSVITAPMTGIPGLCLQWLLIPVVLVAVDHGARARGERLPMDGADA